jgi:predicted HAD superfamily Cof-like phosphohydrolase
MSLLSTSVEDTSEYEPQEDRRKANQDERQKVRQEILMKLLSHDGVRNVFENTNIPYFSDMNLKSDVIPYVDKGLECLTEIVNRNSTHTKFVRNFTEQSLETKLPTTPSKMTKEEVKFIVRMVISEMMELCTTVTPTVRDALDLFDECVETTDNPKLFDPASKSDVEIMAEQYDSFVDAWYYMLNMAVKKGADLDRIFKVVHRANMAKRFPDGKFHRREDGKVMKPDGWKEPDIVGEIKRQMEEEN